MCFFSIAQSPLPPPPLPTPLPTPLPPPVRVVYVAGVPFRIGEDEADYLLEDSSEDTAYFKIG